jgi:hypothetical protein
MIRKASHDVAEHNEHATGLGNLPDADAAVVCVSPSGEKWCPEEDWLPGKENGDFACI